MDQRNIETRKRKRGPYKQYQYSTSDVPKSTVYRQVELSTSTTNQPIPVRTKNKEVPNDTSSSPQTTAQSCHEETLATDHDSCSPVCLPDETTKTCTPRKLSLQENASPDSDDIWRQVAADESESEVNEGENGHFDEEELLMDVDEFECAPTTPPQSPDNNDSCDEEKAQASALHLSTKNRIKVLLLLATKKQHKLTYPAAEAIMHLSGVLSGEDHPFLPSKHLLKAAINHYSALLEEHHICPSCSSYVGVLIELTPCAKCTTDIDPIKNKREGNIFLYLSFGEQIKALLESGLFNEILKSQDCKKINFGNFEDINDGKYYKERLKNLQGDLLLNCNFFVDGLQVATTSKMSAWPVLLVLNNLPLHLRRKFVMMASVWIGKTKPKMNEYLKPFVVECNRLARDGVAIKFNGIVRQLKIIMLVGVSDSIARPLMRNSAQFNGQFGCGLCLHPGFLMRQGRGRTRSYSIRDGGFPRRTHGETTDLGTQAEILGAPQQGIKGLSILANIEGFDIIDCLDLDLFHALVNVAKRFANLWFHKKYKNSPFNACDKLSSVDDRLSAIRITDHISRAPRSLKERSDFRGHEWFHWVVFYSLPVMSGIIPQRYLNHWALLVNAIAVVMQNSVSKSEVVYAGRYLVQFNQDIDDLYGKEHVTFSVHLLTHLQKSVELFGQPWSHSAFIFEHFNGELKNAVKSSNGVAKQLVKHMELRIALKKMEEDLSDDMTEKEKNYLKMCTTSSKVLAEPHASVGAAALLGQPCLLKFSHEQHQSLTRARIAWDIQKEYPTYDRILLAGEVYQSCNYSRVSKQDNSVVLLDSNQIYQIHSFVVIRGGCYALGHMLKQTNQKKLCDKVLPHIYMVEEDHEVFCRCIPVSKFQSKLLSFCVQVSVNERLRVACVNVLRMEVLT